MVHELYSIIAFVCVLVVGVLAIKASTVRYSSVHKKPFVLLFWVSIIFCLFDTFWGIAASKMLFESRKVLVFFSYCFHFGASITTFYWFRFNLKFMDNKITNNIYIKIFSDIVLLCLSTLIISNFFLNTIFVVTPDCVYHTCPARQVLFFWQYTLFVVMFLISLISRLVEKDVQKCANITISISYSIIPLLSGIFQLFYPDMPVYSLGFMFCCLILYSFVLTNENERLIATEQKSKALQEYQNILQRNYSIISSLAGNYDYVCLINAVENTIQNLNVSGIFLDFISKSDEYISPGRFDAMLNKIVSDDCIDEFIKSVDRRIIEDKVKNGERVSVEFKISYKDSNDHYRMSIAIDKDNNDNFLCGFKNMEYEFVMRKELEQQKNYISNLEAQNEIAVLMASIDGLTGLLNKLSFIEKVERYISDNTSKNCALLFFDMDHFKSINDVLGHEKGDEALKEMSVKLKGLFRSDELIARMGGDEFCIFLPCVSYEIVEKRICLMNEKLKAVYSGNNATINTSASIGCVYCKDTNLTYVDMHKIADSAMYEVKNRGRDGHEIKVV